MPCEYNQGEFCKKHSRIVGDVLRWYAEQLGYGSEADFWEAVGILHDVDLCHNAVLSAVRINGILNKGS